MLGLMLAVAAAEVVVVEVVVVVVSEVAFAPLVVFVPTISTAVFALTVVSTVAADVVVAAVVVKLFVLSFEMGLLLPTAATVEFVALSLLNGADLSFPNDFAAIVGL